MGLKRKRKGLMGEFGIVTALISLSLTIVCGVSGIPTGATLKWKDLSYSISVGTGASLREKNILKNITGFAEPGRLIAIMGPTGSGKTTLLNFLAARTLYCKGAHMSGELLVNGEKRDEETFRQQSAFVQQDDVLYAHQTVEEMLTMAAQLRLKGMTGEQNSKVVQGLIQQLGLVKAKHTEIGDARAAVRGVSGGERKRVNLGIELTADPGVLFLDEPTSGLDSFQAEAVVRVLGKLCREGRTVLLSIHQPSSQVFAMFDQLMLLTEGRCVYYGPAPEAVTYFAKLGYKCPAEFNPADFLLETISVDHRSEAALEKSTDAVHKIIAAAEHQEQYKKKKIQRSPSRGHCMTTHSVLRMRSLSDIITMLNEPTGEAAGAAIPRPPAAVLAPGGVPGGCKGGFKLPTGGKWSAQFQALHNRCRIEVWRNPTALVIRGLSTLVFAVSLAGLYSKQNIDAQKAIQDRAGALFFMVVNQAFGMLGPVLSSFDTERQVVMREQIAHCYPLSAYFCAKVLSEVPVAVLLPAIFGSIVYPALRLQRSWKKFFSFMLILVLNALAATSLGLAVSAASPSIQVATSVAPVCMVLLLLLGGFYVNTANIPAAWRCISHLSFVRWSFAGLAINEFKGLTLADCPEGASGCVKTGEQVLARLSLDSLTLSDALFGQLALVLFLNAVAYVGLCHNQPRFQTLSDSEVDVAPPPPPSASSTEAT